MADIDIKDFSCYTELENYIENRYILDVSRFTGYLDLSLNYLNVPCYSVYDLYGRVIFSFDDRVFWVDSDKRRHIVKNLSDLEKAQGDLYRVNGYLAMSLKSIREEQYLKEPPDSCKAETLVEVLIADTADSMYKNCHVSREFISLEHALRFDDMHGKQYDRVKQEIAAAQNSIMSYLDSFADRRTWKELFIHRKNDHLVLDIGVDIRIKKWYLDKFEQEDKEREEQIEREQIEMIKNGYY